MKSFLGLAFYYRRYVQGFASIARPLHKARETSCTLHWTDEAQHAFDALKISLTTTPILPFPSLQKTFILYTDAKQFAMGVVLAQEHDGCERVICYASRALTKSHSEYSAARPELLATVTFTRHFGHYLLEFRFTVNTDPIQMAKQRVGWKS